MEFKLLGPLEAWHAGKEVSLGSGRQRALLALLLLRANEVVSTERLVDELWAGRPPDTAVKVLQGYVSNLRRALSDAGVDGTRILATRAPGYVLNVADDELDSRRFEALTARARAVLETDAARASELLTEALALFRGEPLVDVRYEEFAQAEAARLEELRLAALEHRLEADLALGRHHTLVAELEELVRAHPLRERFREQLMLALYRSGRQSDALDAYRAARRQLVDELGIEPTRRLQELEQAILRQDPALDAPPFMAAPQRDGRPRGRPRRMPIIAAAVAIVAVVAAVVAAAVNREDGGPSVLPNSLVQIDPDTNAVVDVVRTGREPVAVEAFAEHLWTANSGDDTLTHRNTRSGETRTIGGFAYPRSLMAEGSRLWVGSNATGTLIALDGTSGREAARLATSTSGAASIAYGAGALWVVEEEVAVVRIDPVSQRVTRWPDRSARAVAFGHGAAWVTRGGAGDLVRIDARDLGWRRTALGGNPGAVAVGFGAVWVASAEHDAIRRIAPFTMLVEDVIDVRDVPGAVAVGAGSVWVANHGDGTVSRIDPDTNEVAATIRTGYFPTSVAAGAGHIWVAVSGTKLF